MSFMKRRGSEGRGGAGGDVVRNGGINSMYRGANSSGDGDRRAMPKVSVK